MERGQFITSCTVSDSKCVCFDELTKEEKKLIDENTIKVNYNKGESICKHGAFASNIIYLKEGLAKVFMEGLNESLILRIIPPGNLIGLTSVLEGNEVFHYSASAYVDSRASLINLNAFRQVLTSNPKFATSVINILCENSLQTFGRFYSITHKQTFGRLADILLCLSERIFKNTVFELNLTRKELAELTGMSTESVIRMLTKFKNDGLIEINGKSLMVKNYDLLRKIAEYG